MINAIEAPRRGGNCDNRIFFDKLNVRICRQVLRVVVIHLDREAFNALLVCVVDFGAFVTPGAICDVRHIFTGVHYHNVLTGDLLRAAMDTPIAAEGTNGRQAKPGEQHC